MDNTLLHTKEGIAPVHAIIEQQAEARSVLDDEKDIRWEALRQRVGTIGARTALDEAMMPHGNILVDYAWFVLVCLAMIVVIGKCAPNPDERDPAKGTHIPAEVRGTP